LYQDRFLDEASRFEQGVETKEGELKTISSLKMKQADGELKGAMAVLKVSKALGLGDVLSIPLPHSGIWVTIKPPAEKDLIDFYNNIFKEKIAIGRVQGRQAQERHHGGHGGAPDGRRNARCVGLLRQQEGACGHRQEQGPGGHR
jgi:hypothetical protein